MTKIDTSSNKSPDRSQEHAIQPNSAPFLPKLVLTRLFRLLCYYIGCCLYGSANNDVKSLSTKEVEVITSNRQTTPTTREQNLLTLAERTSKLFEKL